MKIGRKTLSVLLALVMMLSLLPQAAFAAPEDDAPAPAEELVAEPAPEESVPAEEATQEPEQAPVPADGPQDSGHNFTTQPTGGKIAPGGTLMSEWALNFTPVKVQIIKRMFQPVGLDTYNVVIDTRYGFLDRYQLTYDQVAENHERLYGFYIRAFYADDTTSFVESNSIPISFVYRQFTTQPTSSGPVAPDGVVPISWDTNFAPVKVTIIQRRLQPGSGMNTYDKTIDLLSGSVKSYDLPYELFTGDVNGMYVRAYYADDADSYVESQRIWSNPTPRAFTTQPTGGDVVPNGWLTTTWKTNFAPVMVTIVRKECMPQGFDTYDTLVDTLSGNARSYTLTYDQLTAATGRLDGFYVRAYYADGTDTYKESTRINVNLLPAVPPSITTTTGLPGGKIGQFYVFHLQAVGGEPITWSLDNYGTGLPPGISLTSEGLLIGEPEENGAYVFRVKASNIAGSDMCVLGIIVGSAPEITATNLGTAYTGVTWSRSLADCADGDQIEWSLVSGTLPPGIGLHGGSLVGAPTAAGTYSFTLRAANYAGADEAEFTLTVADPAIHLSASPAQLTFDALDAGYGYSQVVAAAEVVFTNMGQQALSGLSFVLANGDTSAFEITRIKGLDPDSANGNVNLAPAGYGSSSQVSVLVRRAYGLSAGTYTANLNVKQGGRTICTVPLNFTVNAIPDPPPPQQLFEVDSGGKTWTLHDYHDNNHTEAGGWFSTEDGGPLEITLTKKSGTEYDLNVSIQSDEGWAYFYLYGNGEFHEPADVSADGASFTLHMPYSGTCSFYVWPDNITQGMDVSATLRISSGTDTVELPLRAIGAEPYVRSVEVIPYNPTITVEEGYTQAETEMVYAVTNTGTTDLRNLKFELYSMDDESLYTIEGKNNTELAVGETKLFSVSMAAGQSAGTYGGTLRIQAYELSPVTPYYTVVITRPVQYVTGRAAIVGSGVHGQALSIALEGTPTDAEPTITWHVPGSQGGTADLIQETYTPAKNHVGREISCTVTFAGYEGGLEAGPVTVCHDWYVVQRYREPSCTEDGLIAYGCAVDGCSANKTENPPALGHWIVNVSAKEATCEEQGNQEYWTCVRCDECWLDEAGTQSTTYDAVHMPIDPDNHVINEAHFPDAAFRAFVAENFDTDHSGTLSAAERLAVTEISCAELGIASLAGIEYFPNLDYLDCSYNQLDSLDLSGNPLLTELDCSYNESLTALDLSALPNFALLTCSGCVSLTALDVSGNPELTELDCRECALTALDLSSNSKLWYLDCSGNALTELDLSALAVLRYLMCNDNELTELELNHPALEYIDCYRNALTELDLSACPALIYVDCSYNGLMALTLGEQPLLRELYCHENSLTSLDLRGTPLVMDAVLTTTGNLNDGTMIYSKGVVEFYVDPDVILVTTATVYTMAGFEVSATGVAYSDALSRYVLDGRVQTSVWKNGVAPDFTALTYSISGIACNEAWTQLLQTDPEVGGIYYVHFGLSTTSQGQGAVDFSGLSTANCTLTVPGYEVTCISATTRVTSGGYDAVDILFKLCKLLPIDEEHFPDAIFRAYVAENFDPDGDGYLTDAECAVVTTINVNAKGVTSLTGIEYFNELTRLEAENNEIESVDLSYNPLLTNVYLAYSGLWSLDLTGLEQLKVLDVAGNSLAVLDVSDSTELTDLYCSENLLEGLDVSALTKLKTLYCDNNEVESLDLSHNTALTRLGFDANPLTEIDLSANTGLTEIGASSCQLTQLDVSMLPELVRLDCYDNPLQTLRLDSKENLKALYCYEMPDDFVLDISGCPLILDAYRNGTQTVTDVPGLLTFVTYTSGNHVLEIDADQAVIEEPQTQPTAKVYGCSLSLDGDIGVNFYVVLPDEFVNDPDAYIMLNTTRLTLADATDSTSGGQQLYKWKYRVVAKRMPEDVVLNVYNGAGEKLRLESFSTGEDFTESGYATSVSKYIQQTLATSTKVKLIALVKALSDYGSKAQMHFNHNVSAAAPIYNQAAIDAVTAETVEPFRYTKTQTEQPGVSFAALTLVLESETTLKLYFKLNEGVIGDYSFTLDGKAVTPTYSKGYYVVEIKDIAAKNLDKVYTVKVSDSSGVILTVNSCALSYVCQVMNLEGQSEKLLQVVKALYLYNQAANAYFK